MSFEIPKINAPPNVFANALTLLHQLFGISDDDQVVGLEDPKGDADKISETIKTRLDPIVQDYFVQGGMDYGMILLKLV